MRIFELTKKLIEIESITEHEKDVACFLCDYLSKLGYRASLQEAAPGRFNVVALAGRPDVAFTTHLDTVPPYLAYREDEDYIYGRGACDAKGIIAAQIEAAEALRGSGEDRVALLFLVGEERNSDGAICANRNPLGSRYYIDGEPTENKLAIGSKGSLRAEIIARGKAAHSAYPHMGESAILKLLDVLAEIRAMELPYDSVMGQTTCNIGILEGGTKPNIVPDHAKAEIMFRSVAPIEDLKRNLEALVAWRAEVRYPFEVPLTMMSVLDGFETTVVSFASDVPFLSTWGKPFLVGPGSILDAHTEHERISKKQLLEGVEIYLRLARRLLNSPPAE